jgi:HlyD family secretion protein
VAENFPGTPAFFVIAAQVPLPGEQQDAVLPVFHTGCGMMPNQPVDRWRGALQPKARQRVVKKPSGLIVIIEGARGGWHRGAVAGGDGMGIGNGMRGIGLVGIGLLAGCGQAPPAALGTLEWDRITVPAPAAEVIATVEVREGQQVKAGAVLMQLDPARGDAQFAAAQADTVRAQAQLEELKIGPRQEQIAQAQAQLAALRAQSAEATAYYRRVQPLARQRLIAASELDRARAAAGSAEASVRAAEQAWLELVHGSRAQDIAQGQAAADAAQAQQVVQGVNLQKLQLRAPRDGVVDALPYRQGDQAPIGAPLAVMLVGERPYARVYLPQPLRLQVKVGQAAQVQLEDGSTVLKGHVRSIRSEPSFTPYYALTGDDVERLSYLAEIEVDTATDMQKLPAGLPVQVRF